MSSSPMPASWSVPARQGAAGSRVGTASRSRTTYFARTVASFESSRYVAQRNQKCRAGGISGAMEEAMPAPDLLVACASLHEATQRYEELRDILFEASA